MKYKYLFFDVDGTLTDSFEGVSNGFSYMFNKYNITVDKALHYEYVGPPLQESFKIYFNTPQEISQAIDVFREYYLSKGLYENKLFPDIENMLQEVKKRGYKIFTATSKNELQAKKILLNLGIDKYIDIVFGADHSVGRIEKEDVLHYALETLHISANDCLMIGDTKYDKVGADKVKIDCMLCYFGYGKNEELKALNACYYVNSVMEIVEVLDKTIE